MIVVDPAKWYVVDVDKRKLHYTNAFISREECEAHFSGIDFLDNSNPYAAWSGTMIVAHHYDT